MMKSDKPVNTKCPVMGSDIDPEEVPDNLKRTFKGQTVGFCCAGCPDKWDEFTEEEKKEKLESSR